MDRDGGRRVGLADMSGPREIIFAAIGDVHANMHAFVDVVQGWEQEVGASVSFVLQTGDFEPHRDEADLQTMAAPAKHKQVGSFPEFVSGQAAFPWPVYFIGGNHEPYGFLDQHPDGTWIADNCRYLGRVGTITLEGLRIVFVSGIHREADFGSTRPPAERISKIPNRRFTAITEADIEAALSFESADILMMHDWPEGIVSPSDHDFIEQHCRRLRLQQLGNPYGRLLVELLAPKLVFCGHMHMRYQAELKASEGGSARIYCLGRVEQGRDALAVFRVSSEGQIHEIT